MAQLARVPRHHRTAECSVYGLLTAHDTDGDTRHRCRHDTHNLRVQTVLPPPRPIVRQSSAAGAGAGAGGDPSTTVGVEKGGCCKKSVHCPGSSVSLRTGSSMFISSPGGVPGAGLDPTGETSASLFSPSSISASWLSSPPACSLLPPSSRLLPSQVLSPQSSNALEHRSLCGMLYSHCMLCA